MIKPAKLAQENFIVLLPNLEDIAEISNLREIISDYYNVDGYKFPPELHLTIDRIKKEKSNLAVAEIQTIIKDIPKLKISIDNINCIKTDDLFLTVNVENTKPLLNFTKQLHSHLKEKNISTIDNYAEWNFHITLINNNLVENPIPKQEFQEICQVLDQKTTETTANIEKIEIWQANLDPEKKVIASFEID